MCGFVCFFGSPADVSYINNCFYHFDRIQYRGPDNTRRLTLNEGVHFTFHRLAIMDQTASGDQPIRHPENNDLILVCNGEIYNHEKLTEQYGFKLESRSDCEVILHMYEKFGIERTVCELDGVFSFVLYDRRSGMIHAARDPIGVRPAFIGKTNIGGIIISSEAKAAAGLCNDVEPFPPGKCYSWPLRHLGKPWQYTFYPYRYTQSPLTREDAILDSIRTILTDSVRKRLMSDREIGCLLSGGLDSSLITALVVKELKRPVKTFSIGMEGSIDLEYARKVADHLGTEHHEIIMTEEEFLNAIPEVIHNIESYDTTTVRASVGNYLVSKYISENTNCKVVFNGDGSDEVCAGYIYMKKAPTPEALQKETLRLVKELHLFDLLRSDRSISSNGLEARTPFLDREFVDFYLSLHPKWKQFDDEVLEKSMLRKAFDGMDLLPKEVLWRRKCAFSDGVSNQKKSWHRIIQGYVNGLITDAEFHASKRKFTHCPPVLKESYYYRRVFEAFFGNLHNLIPHFWLPKWTNVIDPSARELDGYQE